MPASLPETQLGQYRLDAKLGEGGMGVVYQATDEKLHREVAIKVLHPSLLQHENLKERFRREARMHAKLMHPNVVTLLSIYEDESHMAIVMEMVYGKNLKEYLRDNPNMTVADTVHIALAVLKGLEAAHQLSMVHRDLKPANVLIANDGAIKLMDFGLAKPERGDDDLTQDGATVGSFRYMAPEQILNQPIDARTDLYAFGILLYQMFTDRLPFDSPGNGGGEFQIMEKQVREEAVSPQEINRDLPLEISDLILQLLAKSQSDRPQNCAEVRKVLSLFQHSEQQSKQQMDSVRIPRGPAEKMSDKDIAKGLIKAAVAYVSNMLVRLKKESLSMLSKSATWVFNHQALGWIKDRVKDKIKFLSFKNIKLPSMDISWKAPVAWVGVALFMVGLGWMLISVIDLADQAVDSDHLNASQSTMITSPVNKDAVTAKTPEPVKSDKALAEAVILAKPEPKKEAEQKNLEKKRVEKPTKKVVKSTPKKVKKKVSRSITYKVSHQVKRHDFSKVNAKKHEFRGGRTVFFASLKDYKWKDRFRSFKKGETKVILKKATKLSRIVINKASVGRLNFKGGYVNLAVKDSKGHWHELFERQDDDVDIRVIITKPRKYLKDVKAVRLRFKTPEPITIGPIDLLR